MLVQVQSYQYMFNKLLLLSLLYGLIFCQVCHWAKIGNTYPEEDFYFQKNDSNLYELHGWQSYDEIKNDNRNHNKFYQSLFEIKNSEFRRQVLSQLSCVYVNSSTVAKQMNNTIKVADFQTAFELSEGYVCTIPDNKTVIGVRYQLNVFNVDFHYLGAWSSYMDLIDNITQAQFKKNVRKYKDIVAKKMSQSKLTSLAVRANTYIKKQFTESSFNYSLNLALTKSLIDPEEVKDRSPVIDEGFLVLLPPKTKLLIGRIRNGNPRLMQIYTKQSLTECTFHEGHLRSRRSSWEE